MTATKVIGLDLSIRSTGIAWHDGTYTTLRPTAEGDQRLYQIVHWLAPWDERVWTVDLVVIEDLPIHARAAGILGMVQGVVRVELIAQDISYITVPPATLKMYATGYGRALKHDMRAALYQHTGQDLADDDQCDAAWLRALGHDLLGDPIVTLPQVNRSALDKLHLPSGKNPADA